MKLRINEILITEEEELKQGIVDAFKALLSDQGKWRANPEALNFSKIDQSDIQDWNCPSQKKKCILLSTSLMGLRHQVRKVL